MSLGVEFDLRKRLYAHLQSLELGFFDRQQTGQLMSRATVDLQAVRFFLGYGLVFIMQSALTIVLAAVAMFVVDPVLAAISLVAGAVRGRRSPRATAAARGRRMQEVQQRIAELTADAEENDLRRARRQGLRARGPPARALPRTRRRASSTRRWSRRGCSAFYSPFIGFLPQLGLAAILLFGGRQVIDGTLTLGEFTAFYTYLLMLLAPMRTLGMSLGLAQRATASGARLFEILDREPRDRAPRAGAPAAAGRATGASSCAT